MDAIRVIQSGVEYLKTIIRLQPGRQGVVTPILIDTEAQNTATKPEETVSVLQSLARAAAQKQQPASSSVDAKARARAALLSGGLSLAPAPVNPAPAPSAYSYAQKMQQQFSSPPAVPTYVGGAGGPSGGQSVIQSGYPMQPPAPAAPAPGVIGLDDLASATAGFGTPGGLGILSRNNVGPAIGNGFDLPGSHAQAGIIFTEDQSRSMLDRMFDAKGVNPPMATSPSPQGHSVSVEKLIPPINEKEASHERMPEISELEAKRTQEFERIQSRQIQHGAPVAGGVAAGSRMAMPF